MRLSHSSRRAGLLSKLGIVALPAILAAAASAQAPVSYSSVTQLNSLLAQLQQTSQTTQIDLAKLRVDKLKTDSNTKKEIESNVESLQRNLQNALPAIIGELRASPENLTITFKLYRNLDALYDVFRSVAESAGAFGSKDDFQSLDNDLNNLERSRRALADRLDSLATAKEAELGQLHTEVRNLQAMVNSAPPKKVIVDDTEPAKKPVKKKAPSKSKASSTKSTSTGTTTKPQ